MKNPSAAELLEVAASTGAPCLSLYLPTHRSGPEARQNPVQLRRMLRLAEERLLQHGSAPSEIEAMLAPAQRWLADPDHWRHPADGLAMFVGPGFFRAFALDFPPRETLCVEKRFRLRPLLGLLAGRKRFYVLALSTNHVRLLEATLDGFHLAVRRLAPAHLPADMTDALGPMTFYSDTQAHSASNPALRGRRGLVHGQGDADQEHYKSDLLNYFRVVAGALQNALADREAPLVLAAVAEYLPLYRAASHDPRLADRVVAGNPDLEADATLAERALPILASRIRRRGPGELRRLEDLAGSPRVVRTMPEIARAAEQGRIEALFLTPDAEQWGAVDATSGEPRVHARKRSGDEDLVERAALAAAARGGVVHVLARGEMPEAGDVVALLRY